MFDRFLIVGTRAREYLLHYGVNPEQMFMAPHFVDHLDVEDVKVEKVDIIDPRHAEVEISLAKPDDNILLFVRKYYPASAKGRR